MTACSASLLMAFVAWPAGAGATTCSAALPDVPATPIEPGAGGSKFLLAEAACGPLGLSKTAVSPREGRPRVAEQLRLYSEDPAGPLPSVVIAAPPTRSSRQPQPSVARGQQPHGGTVARIVALVPAVTEAARRFGIDPLLLHAVAHVESRHQAAAQSPAGARGVLQVMPATARRFGLDDPRRELLEPALNIQVGAEYLKALQLRFGNDLQLVLAAYNAGEGAVEKYGRRIPPYPETQAYVRDVLATYAELRRRVGGPAVAGSV